MQRILVIDDEAHIRHMMRITLEAAGYEVGEAADGLEAWRCVALTQSGTSCCWTRRCRVSMALKRSVVSASVLQRHA